MAHGTHLKERYYQGKHRRSGGPNRYIAEKAERGGTGRFFKGLAVSVVAVVLALAVFLAIRTNPNTAPANPTATFMHEAEAKSSGTPAQTQPGVSAQATGTATPQITPVPTKTANSAPVPSQTKKAGIVGVVFDRTVLAEDTAILQKIEAASTAAIKSGKIGGVKYYTSGDANQQLQDMKSLVNSRAAAVIIRVANRKTYGLLTDAAKNAGIPVVAVDAPISRGYAVNITLNRATWGQKTADFLTRNLSLGNYTGIMNIRAEAAERHRFGNMQKRLAISKKVLPVRKITNKTVQIQSVLSTLGNVLNTTQAIVCGQGMAKDILNTCARNGVFPKVLCGDATAGFIKLWHTLKTTGVAQTKTSKKIKLTSGTLLCAEPDTSGLGTAAVQFALRFLEGKSLKKGVKNIYSYQSKILVTDKNLEKYYAWVKNRPDSFLIGGLGIEAEVDALFS